MRLERLLMRAMRDAALSIRDLVGSRTPEQVDADPMRRSALLWHFTVLGEAASQVPSEAKDSHPHIPWRAATRLRNRIVHGYWNIDVETLVATAVDDLPAMLAELEEAITGSERPEDLDPSSDTGTGGTSAR